jgi:hypothetical protein
MKTSEVLNKAADLIEERGWGIGSTTWGDCHPDGPLCIEGGIAAAMGLVANEPPSSGGIWPEDLNACPAAMAVRGYLGTTDPYLYMWNDHIPKSARDVVEVLRATAVIEAAREDALAPVEVSA